MTVKVLIREAVAADGVALAAVEASATATLRQVYAPTPQACCERANQKIPITRIVACTGGNRVGTLRYWISGDRLHLLGLGVHDSYRRQGVARAMIGYLAEVAQRQGLTRLSLYTVRETGNVPVFQRLGFQVVREEPARLLVSVMGHPLSEAYMERPIERAR